MPPPSKSVGSLSSMLQLIRVLRGMGRCGGGQWWRMRLTGRGGHDTGKEMQTVRGGAAYPVTMKADGHTILSR